MIDDLNLTDDVIWEKSKRHDLFFSPQIIPIELDDRETKWRMIVKANDKKMFVRKVSGIQSGDIIYGNSSRAKAIVTSIVDVGERQLIILKPVFGNFNIGETVKFGRKYEENKLRTVQTTDITDLERYREEISIQTDNYILVENFLIHKAVTDYGLNAKLNLKNSGIYKNSVFSMVYDFSKGAVSNEETDLSDGGLSYQLLVRNSYNGTVKLDVELIIFRIICSNMLAIPVTKVRAMKKHYYGNFSADGKKSKQVSDDVQKRIFSLIDQVVNDEVFDSIRDKILFAKKTKEVNLSYRFLQKFPINQLIVLLGMINQYSKINVNFIDSRNKSSNINTSVGLKEVMNFIVGDRKSGEDIYKSRHWDSIEEIRKLSYPEKVNSLWGVYNLFIKVIQVMIKDKEQRLNKTRMIGKYLLS